MIGGLPIKALRCTHCGEHGRMWLQVDCLCLLCDPCVERGHTCPEEPHPVLGAPASTEAAKPQSSQGVMDTSGRLGSLSLGARANRAISSVSEGSLSEEAPCYAECLNFFSTCRWVLTGQCLRDANRDE